MDTVCVSVPVCVCMCANKFPKPKPNTLSLDFWWKNFSPVAVNLNQHGQPPSVGSKGNWSKLHATRDTQTNSKEWGREERGRGHRMGHGWAAAVATLFASLSLCLLRRACLTCHYLMRVHKKLNQNALHAPGKGGWLWGRCGCVWP